MKITVSHLRAIIGEESRRMRATRGGKRLREATRDPRNLESDLLELAPGETLELETFGGGDYDPGRLRRRRLLITRVDDEDGSMYDLEDEGTVPQFTITSYSAGDTSNIEADLRKAGLTMDDIDTVVETLNQMSR